MTGNLVTLIVVAVLFLSFVYYLHLTLPRAYRAPSANLDTNKRDTPRHQEELFADFMEQVGARMLQVDAWEQKMAWQRLQTDLLLRKHYGFDKEDSDADSDKFTLQKLHDIEDKDAAQNRRERDKYTRTIEGRLVDRVHAAFSLAPDVPHAYGGVQVPFTLEEFRDYIVGFSHDIHREYRREQVLEEIRGRKRSRDAPRLARPSLLKQHLEDGQLRVEGDFIVWATRKYLKYSRFRQSLDASSEDEGEVDMPVGVDIEATSPHSFKMYPYTGYATPGDRVADYAEYDANKDKYVPEDRSSPESIHRDRLENDPQYLRPRADRQVNVG